MAEPIPTNPTSGQLERVNPAGSNAKPASLYVGDLLPSVTESTLFDIFKDIGDVVSIRVCRDANSRQSLGYAYVNFSSRQKADLAIDTYNFHNIMGRPCRIMWQLRDPSLRKSGVGNLFIKNLEPTIDQMGLYDTFSTFGSILSCKVALDNHGKSKGYGFVHFSSEEEANKAISSLNGMLLNGKAVTISPFIPRKDRNIKNPEETFTNVYTKDLDESIKTTEDLNRLFEKFGKITSGKLMTDINNVSKGFGFVNFQDHEAAAAAVNNLNGKEIGDGKKSLYVARAQTKDERKKYLEKRREETQKKYQGHNLYVKNIDDSIDSEKLREAFSQFGKITSAIVMVNEKGISKGFGFVCFSTTDEANDALAKMNSSMLANKQLYVAMAQPIEHRRAQLSAQHAARPGPMRGHGMPIYQGGMVPYMGYPGPRPFGGAPVRPGPGGVPRGMYPGPQGGQRGMPNQSFGGPGRGKPVGANVNKPPHAQPGRQPEGGDDIADQLISALQDTDAFNTVIGGLLTKRLQTFVEPERLPKVTGMILLEITNSDNPSEKAKFLLGSDQSLNEKVQQCLDILAKESQ